MTIKLIIFDLDGVLVDSREMHYTALNTALTEISPECVITKEEHLSTFDGLNTTKKLKILTQTKGLSPNLYSVIWKKKQEITANIINTSYTHDDRVRSILRELKQQGFLIYVASNCVHKSVQIILLRKGFMEFVDYFISSEDVTNPKPSPEIYFKCMIRANVGCKETIIVEDSHIGRTAVVSAGAILLPVENSTKLSLEKIKSCVALYNNNQKPQKWQGFCNVVIPMAGQGSRFCNYNFPKPLIDVNGKPMIQVVVENLGLDTEKCRFIFICRKEHVAKYNLKYLLQAIVPNCVIIETDGLTAGAACSILLAKEYINNSDNLVLANSDQYMEWDSNNFMYSMIADSIDGGIATFENYHPKWSYAKLDTDGFVEEIAEKKPISKHATTGIYYWKYGSDFVKYSEQMIEKNIRTNNEFYTAPVFNEAILDKKKIKIYPIERMWGLGVPEDLNYFLTHYKI